MPAPHKTLAKAVAYAVSAGLIPDMTDASEYAALRSGALLVDRSERVRIRFTGPKAAESITGLVTNDVLSLTPGQGQYAAALTPKGKIAADVRIFVSDGSILTDTASRAGPGWRDIVRRYVNPRIAPYRDVTDETCCLGVFGPKASRVVATATGSSEELLDDLGSYDHTSVGEGAGQLSVIRVDELDVPGYEIVVGLTAVGSLRERLLGAGATSGSMGAWDIARIEAGWPEWGVDINDSTIPQEANFDELGAISYTKGCYTGQETVARVHFRGHVNRFLRRLHFVSASMPPVNAELMDDAGTVVGDVRSVAMSPRHGGVALAMVRREVAPGTTLHARWEGGECTMQIAAQEKGATG